MNKKKVILIADSCAGGIAVLRNILVDDDDCHFVYLCDGGKNPFGLKSQIELQNIVIDWLHFAQRIHSSALVVACNTASAAIQPVREKLETLFNIPIISMVDAAKTAFNSNNSLIENRRVVLFGTKYTVSSHLLDSSLNEYHPKDIQYIVGTNSERLVARGKLNSQEDLVLAQKELEMLKDSSINTIILACTCFEFLSDIIYAMHPGIDVININEYVASLIPHVDKYHYGKAHVKDLEFLTTGNLKEWTRNINVITRIAMHTVVDVRGISIH